MTVPDELSYERAVHRIPRLMAAIAGVGTAVGFAALGWKGGAGFLVGALLSTIQYIWLKALVDSLAGSSSNARGLRAALRFLVLAGTAYVIFRFSPVSLKAALAGIFVLTAAVFVEVAIEIVYARK